MTYRRIILILLLVIFSTLACADSDDDDDNDNDTSPVDDDDTIDDDDSIDDDDDATPDDDDDDTIDDDTIDDDDDDYPQLYPDKCILDEPPDLNGFDPDYELVSSGQPVKDKNFYLLTLFQVVSEIAEALADDTVIAVLSAQRDDDLRTAAATCGTDPNCYADALIWSTPDAEAMANELVRLFVTVKKDDLLVDEHMRPSGMFQFYADETDDEMLTLAWLDAVQWMNDVFYEYALSLEAAALDDLINDLCDDHPQAFAFFEPLLEVGHAAMIELDRDEAGRYEPLIEGDNQAAYERIPTIDWDLYRFPLMLVPGQGPELDWIELSPIGRWRCDLAVERYLAGLAPLIVFSGGHVHPDQTPYSEAVEMKRYVMETYGIPEDAILIDPHARHTTTNLRNLARIILRYGIPSDRPALITTDFAQAMYITFMLDQRCREELGYLPYRVVKRLSATASCYLPNPPSLFADGNDPLDP